MKCLWKVKLQLFWGRKLINTVGLNLSFVPSP